MARAGAVLLLAVLLAATAGAACDGSQADIFEAGVAALKAEGPAGAAAAFGRTAALTAVEFTGAQLKSWSVSYTKHYKKLFPTGQMPTDPVCIGPDGITSLFNKERVTVGRSAEVSTFPVCKDHMWGAHSTAHPNSYWTGLEAACRTGSVTGCIYHHLQHAHGFAGAPVFLDIMPFVAPSGSGWPITDEEVQEQMLRLCLTSATHLGIRLFHVVSGKAVKLVQRLDGAETVQVSLFGGHVTLIAVPRASLSREGDPWHTDPAWGLLPSDGGDDDGWIFVLCSSHRSSRRSTAAAEAWAPTEAAAAQAAGAANITADDLQTFTRVCADDKEWTDEQFADWRTSLETLCEKNCPTASPYLKKNLAAWRAQGDSNAKIVQRVMGHINGKIGANTMVDDGKGGQIRSCEKAGKIGANTMVDDGKGGQIRHCKKAGKISGDKKASLASEKREKELAAANKQRAKRGLPELHQLPKDVKLARDRERKAQIKASGVQPPKRKIKQMPPRSPALPSKRACKAAPRLSL